MKSVNVLGGGKVNFVVQRASDKLEWIVTLDNKSAKEALDGGVSINTYPGVPTRPPCVTDHNKVAERAQWRSTRGPHQQRWKEDYPRMFRIDKSHKRFHVVIGHREYMGAFGK
eukprot:gnl/TRDRNA2_/TRDRNA2_201340_c0_seq1.p1 gnl/TRDRNA2_/TRDRNA2_201340_c0~~gnl/TRDRNA2_/TRDRNA2_201340_c0_seq1.p1  ORF type:complete len:113 (+),score=7.57 gnl/TRDRNA2_/TRDRNA2_201340_c0_seq1:328-666(+)